MKIAVFADTHNTTWLQHCLKQINADVIISLGDISATDPIEVLPRYKLYSDIFRYKKGVAGYTPKENDLAWFDNINITGWNKQIDIINSIKKQMLLNLGNGDFAYLNWYDLKQSKYLKIITKMEIMGLGNRTFLFLPYNCGIIKNDLLDRLKGVNELIILSHSPPMKDSTKQNYKEVYETIQKLSKVISNVTLFHGHMHPEKTYTYTIKEMPDVKIIALKATDSDTGSGSHNDICYIDSDFKFVDENGKEIQPISLPDRYYMKDCHWNKFDNK